MMEKIKKVCKCEKCGNESEMIITCSLPDSSTESAETPNSIPPENSPLPKKVKGIATCTHCGNEADMWIDL